MVKKGTRLLESREVTIGNLGTIQEIADQTVKQPFIGRVGIVDTNLLPIDIAQTTYSIMRTGERDVAAADACTQLTTTSVPTKQVLVKAKVANTGIVRIGYATGQCHFELSISESVTIPIDNLNKIWLSVSVGGEGVTYMYVAG